MVVAATPTIPAVVKIVEPLRFQNTLALRNKLFICLPHLSVIYWVKQNKKDSALPIKLMTIGHMGFEPITLSLIKHHVFFANWKIKKEEKA